MEESKEKFRGSLISRDEFPPKIKDALAKRVGFQCSNPDCDRQTVGPHTQSDQWVNIGVAAHITAASPGGPRYNSSLSTESRKGISNGIWLCQNCSKKIDDDPEKYTVEYLLKWKSEKETKIDLSLTQKTNSQVVDGPFLAISGPIKLGCRSNVRLVDTTVVPREYVHDLPFDPTFFASGIVYRFVLRPVQKEQPTILQAIGIEVLSVEDIPEYLPLLGVYPARFSNYLLEFADPRIVGESHFIAQTFYSLHAGQRSDELPYQPMILDTDLPEIIDCRICPKHPGYYTLRIYVICSVNTKLHEQTLLSSFKVIVPHSK